MQVQLQNVGSSQVMAQVIDKKQITPAMVRLTLGGFGMSAFLQVEGVHAPAAWVKVSPAGRDGRAYTIRNINMQTGTLDIDFVVHADHGDSHDDGTVSAWAAGVAIGESVEIAGPRSSGFTLDPASQWVWLGADASALPAVHRILDVLPAHVEVTVVAEVDTVQEQQVFESAAQVHIIWLYKQATVEEKESALLAVRKIASQLDGPGQVWTAGESGDVKAWKRFWLEDKELDKAQVKAKGYWKFGEKNFKDKAVIFA